MFEFDQNVITFCVFLTMTSRFGCPEFPRSVPYAGTQAEQFIEKIDNLAVVSFK
jgi:hypothetical protein